MYIIFFVLFIVLAFCDSLIVWVPGVNKWLHVSFIYSIFIITIFYIAFHKVFVKDVQILCLDKLSSFRIYIYLISYIIIQTFILGVLGKVNLLTSLIDIVSQYFLIFPLCYLTTFFMVKSIFKPYLISKIVYLTIYAILLFGLLDFVAYNCNFSILQKFAHLPNTASLVIGHEFIKSFAYGMYRVQSIYIEPGSYGEYLFIFLPFIYFLTFSKLKVFRNNLLNMAVKLSYIPLLWFNIVLTQSPIWLCMNLLLTGIIFYKKIIKNIKRFLIFLIVISSFLLIFNEVSERNETYLSRITKITSNLMGINAIIEAEESFGTRLSCVINLIDIGSKSPIWGIGHTNIKPYMVSQISENKSKVFVTPEMIACILIKSSPSFQDPILVNFFVRYGLISLFLFLYLISKLRRSLKRIFMKDNSVIGSFAKALYISLACIIVVGCYDIGIASYPCHFIIGLCFGMEQYLYDKNNFRI